MAALHPRALVELGAGRADQTRRLLDALFGAATDVWLQPPFHCDYGSNITLGRKVFFNFNCVVLDVAPVSIGNHVLFGPAVQVYTAMHPVDPADTLAPAHSAHVDTFARDHLPPPEQWPELLFDLPAYDPSSVMNYCNPIYNNNGELSKFDVQALQTLYGAP